jgi:glycosyltransferase involved in cell wall biosynthesis
MWSQISLLFLLEKLKPDLFFTPSGLAPIYYKGRIAITIHDMAAYTFPQAFTFAQQVRLRLMIHRNATHASHILAPSLFTAREVERVWGIPSSRLHVTPLAYTFSASGSQPVEGVLPDGPVFLFVGRIETKKNLDTLIRAFALFADKNEGQLVLAGKDGFGATAIRNQVSRLPEDVRRRILFSGYISEDQKAWLLRRASACLVPCKVEGFGLPILEAFAADTPAISSPSGSLPEVGADAVLYAKGDTAEGWAAKMQEILKDPGLAARCRRQGERRLEQYSWSRTSSLTAEALLAEGKAAN